MSIAAAQIQNLLYLLGALVAAGLWISGLYLVRHRKPKSVEAGIESFSRGLRALAPERRPVLPSRPLSAPDPASTTTRSVRPVPLLHPDAGVMGPPAPPDRA